MGTPVAVPVVGARSDFSHAQAIGNCDRKVGAELEAVLRPYTMGVALQRHVFIDQNVGGSSRGKLSVGNGACLLTRCYSTSPAERGP